MDLFETLFSTMKFKNDFEKKKISLLFNEYMQNIPDNFYKNQFELSKEYVGTIEILRKDIHKYEKDFQLIEIHR